MNPTPTPEPVCQCDNCYWSGPESQMPARFPEIPKLLERIEPDGIVPAGECPKCNCLAYIKPSRWMEMQLSNAEKVVLEMVLKKPEDRTKLQP